MKKRIVLLLVTFLPSACAVASTGGSTSEPGIASGSEPGTESAATQGGQSGTESGDDVGCEPPDALFPLDVNERVERVRWSPTEAWSAVEGTHVLNSPEAQLTIETHAGATALRGAKIVSSCSDVASGEERRDDACAPVDCSSMQLEVDAHLRVVFDETIYGPDAAAAATFESTTSTLHVGAPHWAGLFFAGENQAGRACKADVTFAADSKEIIASVDCDNDGSKRSVPVSVNFSKTQSDGT